jgi:hypothetical protein
VTCGGLNVGARGARGGPCNWLSLIIGGAAGCLVNAVAEPCTRIPEGRCSRRDSSVSYVCDPVYEHHQTRQRKGGSRPTATCRHATAVADVASLRREQSGEERPVALQPDAQILRRRVLAFAPLRL